MKLVRTPRTAKLPTLAVATPAINTASIGENMDMLHRGIRQEVFATEQAICGKSTPKPLERSSECR